MAPAPGNTAWIPVFGNSPSCRQVAAPAGEWTKVRQTAAGAKHYFQLDSANRVVRRFKAGHNGTPLAFINLRLDCGALGTVRSGSK